MKAFLLNPKHPMTLLKLFGDRETCPLQEEGFTACKLNIYDTWIVSLSTLKLSSVSLFFLLISYLMQYKKKTGK